jgi:hypothetical protein
MEGKAGCKDMSELRNASRSQTLPLDESVATLDSACATVALYSSVQMAITTPSLSSTITNTPTTTNTTTTTTTTTATKFTCLEANYPHNPAQNHRNNRRQPAQKTITKQSNLGVLHHLHGCCEVHVFMLMTRVDCRATQQTNAGNHLLARVDEGHSVSKTWLVRGSKGDRGGVTCGRCCRPRRTSDALLNCRQLTPLVEPQPAAFTGIIRGKAVVNGIDFSHEFLVHSARKVFKAHK